MASNFNNNNVLATNVTYKQDEEFPTLNIFTFTIDGMMSLDWECHENFNTKFWKNWQTKLRNTFNSEPIVLIQDCFGDISIRNFKLNSKVFGSLFADAIDQLLIAQKENLAKEDDFSTNEWSENEIRTENLF